jgi:AcrR family transcriptional regulator
MREESRERLLDSALRLFSREGYDRASVRAIARDAGVATGLLYHYFAGKPEVLEALFERGMADVRASFAAADAAGATTAPAERIAALVRASFAIIGAHIDFWRLSYAVRMQPPVQASLRARTESWTAEILGQLERYVAEAGVPDPAIEARVLFAAIDGAAQHYVLEPDAYPVEEVTHALARRYAVLGRSSA